MFQFKKTTEEKFIQAYDKFADVIFRHCYFRLSDRELARDVTQQTFAKTWDFLRKGGAIQDFPPFLYRVANNLIIDQYRKKKTSSLEELKEKGWEPRLDNRENILNAMEAQEIMKIISQLEDNYRDALIMRYVDDFPIKKIAQINQESENAISIRLFRGLKKIKEIIGQKNGQNNGKNVGTN